MYLKADPTMTVRITEAALISGNNAIANFNAKALKDHPESKYIAGLNSSKAQLEFVKSGCAGLSGACGYLATKLTGNLWVAAELGACAFAGGACGVAVTNAQTQIQTEIDRVKEACADGDQTCYDAITGGKETQAALVYFGPPNNPAGGW